MILIPDQPLPQPISDQLAIYQQQINNVSDYGEQVKKARIDFSRHRKNRVLRKIEAILDEMCSGSRRCMYCEDSCADEIEHVRPKHLYPELTFVWENYLYACGICNPRKNNRFAIFDAQEQPFILTHPNGLPLARPPQGEYVFIDPRQENAMDFLFLDILGGEFTLEAIEAEGSKDEKRATYTVKTLGLNRDILRRARKNAYPAYRAMLREYVGYQYHGSAAEILQRQKEALQRSSHITVWREMQRQYKIIPELKILFDQLPDALRW